MCYSESGAMWTELLDSVTDLSEDCCFGILHDGGRHIHILVPLPFNISVGRVRRKAEHPQKPRTQHIAPIYMVCCMHLSSTHAR